MQARIALLLALLALAGCDSIAWDRTAQHWCENSPHCVCTSEDCVGQERH